MENYLQKKENVFIFFQCRRAYFSFLGPPSQVVSFGLGITVCVWVTWLHSPGIFVFRSIIHKDSFVHWESLCHQFNLFYKFGFQQAYAPSLLTKCTHIPVPSNNKYLVNPKYHLSLNLLKKPFTFPTYDQCHSFLHPLQSVIYFHHSTGFTLSKTYH